MSVKLGNVSITLQSATKFTSSKPLSRKKLVQASEQIHKICLIK